MEKDPVSETFFIVSRIPDKNPVILCFSNAENIKSSVKKRIVDRHSCSEIEKLF
jgi:hypothetical protein